MSTCRFCGNHLSTTVIDLGSSPLANSNLSQIDTNKMEAHYPLHVYFCDACTLVQLDEFEAPENIFSDYVYFSSYSESWLAHAKQYAEKMINLLSLDEKSMALEIASNDGYLLQYFKNQGIPVQGIEPAANVAKAAISKGIPTIIEFFGEKTATQILKKNISADIITANNVLAHVPDINDFVAGLKIILKPEGVITIEFPHLLQLIEQIQFDTIYHEHFSYLSLTVVENIFSRHGLKIFDAESLPTHGGSLRIYATHSERHPDTSENLISIRQKETSAGIQDGSAFAEFREKSVQAKFKLLEFLIQAKKNGKSIVGYGAPAKGNTLLNYCGIGPEFLEYTVDKSPHKQGTFLPGSRIAVFAPGKIEETKPDYVLILPWNLEKEIIEQMNFIRSWGGEFVIPIPSVRVIK